MATADALLSWARSQLGVTEKPPGSNHVRYWPDIGMSGMDALIVNGVVVREGQPWCAAFVLAGLMRVGVGPVTRAVYVPRIRADYQATGRLFPIEQAQPGDQVMFSFGNHTDKTHTGIVVAVDARARTVESIDGNTTPALGSGQEWNGGGVFHRIRPWSQTWGVGRPKFDPTPPPPSIPFPGDHMHQLTKSERGLDGDGNGFTDLFDVPAGHVVAVDVNTAGYGPVPRYKGSQDQGGHAQLQWEGPKNAPAFSFRVWVADS